MDMSVTFEVVQETCLLSKASEDESVLWHTRLGHIHYNNMINLVKK